MKKITKILIGGLAVVLLSFLGFAIDKQYHNSIVGSRTDSGITIWGDIIGDIAEQTDLTALIASSSAEISTSSIGTLINTSTGTTSPVDADEFSIWGSVSNSLQKITWANLKASIKTYIDSLTTTFTNKRITPRIGSIATTTSLTIDSDIYDQYYITGLEATTTIEVSGTPTNGQKLVLGIKASSTAQGLTFSTSSFATSSDLDLPAATTANKTMYLGFIWSSLTSKWNFIALLNNF